MIDANKIDLKKEIEELEKNSVKERGVDIKYLIDWVRRHKGDDGVKLVEQELKKAGFDMPDVTKFDDMEWIPVSLVNSYFVAMIKAFELQEKDIIRMGRELFKSPNILLKMLIKFFVSPKKTLVQGSKIWAKYYTAGKMEVGKCDIKNKKIVINLKKIDRHKFACLYDLGTISMVIKMATGWENVIADETKCTYQGDEYHEFTFQGK